jgi:hypothetical protein
MEKYTVVGVSRQALCLHSIAVTKLFLTPHSFCTDVKLKWTATTMGWNFLSLTFYEKPDSESLIHIKCPFPSACLLAT